MEYMSQEGFDKIASELQHLERVELPRVRDAISEARDKGDLSENFEYHAAKREQGRVLGRIRFLQRVLENARVIDKALLKSDCVGLLSEVEITNLANSHTMKYTIVSPHEADMKTGKSAGAFTVGALWGFRKREDLEENHADAIIAHPLDLLQFV